MPDPLYLTDAERPLRPPDVQRLYRFFAVFRLRRIQYTRWFYDPSARDTYLASHSCEVMNRGEEPDRRLERQILKEINR